MTAASSDQSVNSIRDAFQNVVKTTLQDIYQQNTKLQALLRALPTIDVPNLTITVSEPTIHNSGFSYDKKLDWFYLEQSIRIKHIMAGPRQKEYGLKIRLETNGYKMVDFDPPSNRHENLLSTPHASRLENAVREWIYGVLDKEKINVDLDQVIASAEANRAPDRQLDLS